MDFEIIWTELALGDFRTLVQYAAERNPAGAETLRLRILNSVEVLTRFPYIGPVFERDRSRRTREILCGSYRIFYRVTETPAQVQIVRVWHGSRRQPQLPP